MSNILKVQSSLIEEIEYLDDYDVLRIKFKKYIYDEVFYSGITSDVYTGLYFSKSKGKYYLQNIKDKFSFTFQKQTVMADFKIKIKINVMAILKQWLYQGEKGVYLNATIWYQTEEDKHGNNGMITQDVPKEVWEKDKQVKGAILGNCKVWKDKIATPELTPGSTTGLKAATDEALDDLPF